ncbi:phosphatidylglycerophosphatase A family protein [Methylophaga pinxianii]|uniref:phosphatidylglycerophosphatase A family protein n=1 Tax=Methylophaga pinxianii TaxID=2881052 RepID=UPI001CF56295|nr:phosphatidylglycerophosphatase A [Methylophaga pinxianii]MCB2426609.1 phosphatidylglycerophosphatase A [Methylophaga pinxianii]UPH45494.1 phosphatidylglycerophosphatase A [Methylophaga pinxianii]
MTISLNKISFLDLLKRPVCLLAYGFGAGLSPKAPGTIGTIVALPIYWLLRDLDLIRYLLITVIAFIAGVWICQQAVNWLKQDDPSSVVWDEIVGYLVTMIAAPAGWQWMLLGFVLFRVFDIWKPWPVSLADRKLHGGFGIMVDDVIAGIFAAAALQFCHYML